MRTGIAVSEARALVLEAAQPLAPEIVAFEAALGRVLAEEVRSERTLPPADCSAMDGYAVRGADVAGGWLFTALRSLGVESRAVSLVAIALAAACLALAAALGRAQQRRAGAAGGARRL